jgi:D-tyrosyl-tRNA(Tyr) deacylase
MKAVVQRVSRASVVVEGRVVGEIGRGLCALVGLEAGDAEMDRAWIADKVANLRIFTDEQGKMNLSVVQAAGGILIVPNFTVAGDARKGRRPSFDKAMPPAQAEPEFAALVGAVRAAAPGVSVQQGVFRAHMLVEIVNDGPVTILLDSRSG